VWNGQDGLDAFVNGDVVVGVSSRFSTGVTHLPLYDPEYHPNGYIVHSILPDSTRVNLYWDDSQISGGTTEFEGIMGDTDGHNFPGYDTVEFGNLRTMNTWWNGFEENNLKSFSFTLSSPLPIELIKWEVVYKGAHTQLAWTTASETNNHFFRIQRSSNGIEWKSIATILGAGNSTRYIHYYEVDDEPIEDKAYYRLEQVDYDGTNTYSSIQVVSNSFSQDRNIRVFCSEIHNTIIIEGLRLSQNDIRIRNSLGVDFTESVLFTEISDTRIQIDASTLAAGAYIIQTKHSQRFIYKK